MTENIPRPYHPALSIILTLCAVFLGMQLVGPYLALYIASLFYDMSIITLAKQLQDVYNHPELRPLWMFLQGAGGIVGLIIVPFFILRQQRVSTSIFFSRPFYSQASFYSQAALLTIFIVLAFMIVDAPIGIWNQHLKFPEWMSSFDQWARKFEDALKKATEFVTVFDSHGAFLLGFFVIAIIPAVGEEFVFRGIIQRDFYRGTGNIHVAIWITAAIFSAFHIQFFGFFPRMFLGVVFGYLYYWSGSLWISMIAHFFNNGLIVIALYINQKGLIETNLSDNQTPPWGVVLVAAVIFSALMYVFKKYCAQQPKPPGPAIENSIDSTV